MDETNNFIFSINNLDIANTQINNNGNSLRKLIIVADWIKSYLALEHYKFAEYLLEYGWEIMELSSLDLHYIKKEKCLVLCITYDGFDTSIIKDENVTIIYKIDDLYPYKEIRNHCINNCDILIGPYKHLFHQVENMYNNINNKCSYWIPYSAVNDFYQDININITPKNKILISGIQNEYYPFRKKMYTISQEECYKNKFDTLSHPSYNNYNHNVINKNYYSKLNEYICCFTDALEYNYLLLKIFEITSVGSLLLVVDSISSELNKLGFNDGIHCIMCNENNIYEKIDWILNLNNINEVNSIRKRGMELTRNIHNTKQRAQDFNKLIVYHMENIKNI